MFHIYPPVQEKFQVLLYNWKRKNEENMNFKMQLRAPKNTLRALLLMGLLFLITGCNVPSTPQSSNHEAAAHLRETELFAELLSTANARLATETEANAAGNPESTAEPQSSTFTPNLTATPDAIRTPPALPAVFQTALLNKLDVPHTYVEDTCELIKNRWAPGKAEPGTVVMAIMYHSIIKGDAAAVTLDNQITAEQNKQIGADLKNQGFEAIDMEQFINFIKYNDYIPPRSALLIVDDRHHKEYFVDHFLPFNQDYGWKVINAWISADGTTQALWDGNAEVEAAGYVDHQAHGVVHNENMSDASPEEYIRSELQGSIDRIQEHFHKTPKAIIWPGGSFGFKPIQIAKELGYEVSFTVNPRGPVMYNWIPLADEADPGRPSYLPDGPQDPLFVILAIGIRTSASV